MATPADHTAPPYSPGNVTGDDLAPAELGQLELEDMDEEEEELDEDEVEVEGYDSSSASTSPSTLTWISWYCSLPGHEYFCEVAEDFIEDDFNLTGLSSLVPFYKEAMEMVLDVEAEEEAHRVPDVTIVESSAELLYGLIHQRYIITRQGLQQMYAKYDASHFGQCPRVYCSPSKLVPCGRSDLPGVDTVKLYCPSCVDMYVPPSSRFSKVDGSFFGTTFAHLLFQTYPSSLPFTSTSTTSPSPTTTTTNVAPLPSPTTAASNPPIPSSTSTTTTTTIPTTPLTSLSKVYIPRIYGFKVSERAKSGPRMQWLRMRPRTEDELAWKDQATPGDLSLSFAAQGQGQGQGLEEGGELFEGVKDSEDEEGEEDQEEEEEEEEGTSKAMSGVVGTPPAVSASGTGATTAGGMSQQGRVVKGLPAGGAGIRSPPKAAVGK